MRGGLAGGDGGFQLRDAGGCEGPSAGVEDKETGQAGFRIFYHVDLYVFGWMKVKVFGDRRFYASAEHFQLEAGAAEPGKDGLLCG